MNFNEYAESIRNVGTPVSRIASERMEYIPGNEAVFTANVHFRCELDKEGT